MRQGMNLLLDAYGLNYWLRVMPDNERTINFHKKNGFTIADGHRGGRYENTEGEHGEYLIMTRTGDGYWPKVGE